MTKRTRGLYAVVNGTVEQPEFKPVTVTGAAAIGEVLGIDAKLVYRLFEANKGKENGPPIANVPGIGIAREDMGHDNRAPNMSPSFFAAGISPLNFVHPPVDSETSHCFPSRNYPITNTT
jgi:hypothetical protein